VIANLLVEFCNKSYAQIGANFKIHEDSE